MSESPAIAVALRQAMSSRGISVPDLARDLPWPEPTLYNIVGGKVTMIRSRQLRDALDNYFGAPAGTTYRICQGSGERYPGSLS